MIEITGNIIAVDYYELIITGEVDASSSIHLDEALAEALSSYKNIIVNLSGLEYISSAGLGVFMSVIQKVEADEVGFVLFGLSSKVFDVFEILGLNELINIRADKKEALEVIGYA